MYEIGLFSPFILNFKNYLWFLKCGKFPRQMMKGVKNQALLNLDIEIKINEVQ